MKIGLVGGGRAARTLAPLFEASPLTLHWWWTRRDHERTPTDLEQCDALLFAVSDDAIEDAAQAMATRACAAHEVWLHLSGSRPGGILRVSPGCPKAVGAMHPLQALPGLPLPSSHLEGVVAGIDGEPQAIVYAEQIARALSLTPLTLASESKALYHAAAVTVAGHATALFSQALQMMQAVGFSEASAQAALLPLMRGAVDNLAQGTPAQVITGPIARGDSETVRGHIERLGALSPDLKASYLHLAREALALSSHELSEAERLSLSRLLTTDPESP